jgi:hypothetical protein
VLAAENAVQALQFLQAVLAEAVRAEEFGISGEDLVRATIEVQVDDFAPGCRRDVVDIAFRFLPSCCDDGQRAGRQSGVCDRVAQVQHRSLRAQQQAEGRQASSTRMICTICRSACSTTSVSG